MESYDLYKCEFSHLLDKVGVTEDKDRALQAFDMFLSKYEIIDKSEALSTKVSNQYEEMKRIYVAYCAQKHNSPDSIKNRCYILDKFFLKYNVDPRDVRVVDLLAFFSAYEIKSGNGAAAMNGIRSAFRNFYKAMLALGIVNANPTIMIPDAKVDRIIPVYMDYDGEFTVLLEKVKELNDSKAELLINLMYCTAGRINDIINIKTGDIEVDENGVGTVKILGKGRKERPLFIPAQVMELVKKHIEERKEISPYLICKERAKKGEDRKYTTHALREYFYDVLKRCEINDITDKHITPHAVRRTWATHMAIDKEMPIHDVSRYLGHTSVVVTEHYVGFNNDKLKESYNKYF